MARKSAETGKELNVRDVVNFKGCKFPIVVVSPVKAGRCECVWMTDDGKFQREKIEIWLLEPSSMSTRPAAKNRTRKKVSYLEGKS